MPQSISPGDSDRGAVTRRASTAFCPETFLEHRIVHDADQYLPLWIYSADTHAEARHAVDKIVRAIERIDPPRQRCIGQRGMAAAFLPGDVECRCSLLQQ